MSFLYSVIKPIVRKAVKGSSLHQEESYEEFKQASYDIQKKFKFALPNIKGFEFHDEPLNGFHIIVGKKTGSSPKKAVVYFPGGGSRRWQMPSNGSIKNYIGETGAELWIPLYPLAPDYTLLDEAEFTVQMHKKMLERFSAKDIVWLGYSAGADLLLRAGRHITQKHYDVPMPGLMIPVSCSGLIISEESKKRMHEIDSRDIMLHWDMLDTMVKYYDPKGELPEYILSKPHDDDYTGFPKIIMYFAGDEVFSGLAPDYEKSFKRSGLTDYEIRIEPNMFHAWPVFTFIKEGRDGEQKVIGDINKFFKG